MKKIIAVVFAGLFVVLAAGCASQPRCTEECSTQTGIALVAGATGRTGRLIVKQLLAEGYTVKAYVRNVEKARKLFGDTVDIAVGDIRDQQKVNQAMKGVRWVFSAIGAGGSKDPTNLPEFVDYGGTKNLAEAAIKEKVERFIMVSSRSAGKVDHFLNKRHNNVLIWKKKAEDFLRESELAYTIVRPGGLRDEPGGIHQILAFEPDRDDIKLRRISRADVAATCVVALNHPAAIRKTFAIVNNPDAATISWDQFFKPIAAYKY